MSHRILICGSRNWTDRAAIREALVGLHPDSLIIDGMAPGADTIGYEVSKELGFRHHARFPAQWSAYGAKAGPMRNRLMFKTTQPTLVLAFPMPDSLGTVDMMKIADKAGVPVVTP